MKLSLMIEGQNGLNWTRWRRIVEAAERLGFYGLYRSDHFTNASPPDIDSLEAVVSMTYLASHSQRLRFGALVHPASFRDPVMLTRQAAALTELSDGRFAFGIGAGWSEREHDKFGYDLGDMPTRMARFEEAVEVASLLLTGDPITYDGRFYKLNDASILPKPDPVPPIVVGGNGAHRTLRIAARFASIWNAVFLTPDAFAERSARLDAFAEENGRDPKTIERTMMTGVRPGGAAADAKEMRNKGALAGTYDDINAQLKDLEAAGCEQVMMQWLPLDDLDGLTDLATNVLQ